MTQFGFAIGLQLFLWGLFGPWFGIITDKYGGNIAVFIGFLFYLAGAGLLYSGINTGFYFTLSVGVLIGIGLGATAISIPVSIVAKHFPLSNRTIAIGIVTSAGSFGYFLSPLFTRYSLREVGWETTILFFIILLFLGLIVAFFLSTPKIDSGTNVADALTTAYQQLLDTYSQSGETKKQERWFKLKDTFMQKYTDSGYTATPTSDDIEYMTHYHVKLITQYTQE